MSQTKIPVPAVQFTGSNVKDLEAFGVSVMVVNKTAEDHITVTDNHSQPLQLKKGDWLIKNERGQISVVFDHYFQQAYEVKK